MLISASNIEDAIETDGFALIENFASLSAVETLLATLGDGVLGAGAGTRQLHRRAPAIAAFLECEPVTSRINELLPGGFPVRSILFDKTPETNWRVAWHQDLSICVAEKHDVPGFAPWSVKDGAIHVQPPISVLEGMVTLRLHLDDCAEDNGPLRLIPGSHRGGRLSAEDIRAWRAKGKIASGTVAKGGAVLMKPLILHSSSPAANPNHRRVLHIEFAAAPLPAPLEWIR